MMDKNNLIELLKDCPQGMELDCTMFDNVTFVRVDYSKKQFPIEIAVGGMHSKYLTKEGCFHDTTLLPEAKCVIFPKGKTTWDGFQRPFVDGDIIYVCDEYSDATYTYVAILKQIEKGGEINTHCFYNYEDDVFSTNDFLYDSCNIRFATEKEKEELFKAIKDNGYRWNTENKTLETLVKPKFKVGDIIRHKDDKTVIIITGIKDKYYLIQFYNLKKNDYQNEKISFNSQDYYELIPNKFDINTLKPFESRVLVRDYNSELWRVSFWGCLLDNKEEFKHDTIRGNYKQCIPYEGNEHLLGKADDCNDFYKTW